MDKKESGSRWGLLGVFGALTLPILCCGGPILIAALGTGLGSAFAGVMKNWVLGGILAVLTIAIVTMMFRKSRKGVDCSQTLLKNTGKDDCCTPPINLVNRPKDTKEN